MRKPMVAGNWKLNGSRQSIEVLIAGIKAGLSNVEAAEVAVCPPFVYLSEVADQLAGTSALLGAQDVSEQDDGAYTGEVSGPMLAEVGCQVVIIGHSERRHIYGESDELTAQKFQAVQRAGLLPILCVGETLEEREQDNTEAVIARQLDAVIELLGVGSLATSVIAYEPVWAIGTGKTATPDQAQAVHAFIREKLAALDSSVAANVRILYGGSVKPDNATELFTQNDIDGGLIGGASLKADDFLAICQAAN